MKWPWTKEKKYKDRIISSGGENCPCNKGKFRRIARCDDSTDYLNIHYDICKVCGFETYAHNDYGVKVERYIQWKYGD